MATSKAGRKPPEPGITRISAQGYKSLRDRQDLAIRHLTVLAGVNSSGKSSVMQPLLLLKQTLDASYDPGPLLLDGPHVSVTAIEQVLSKPQARAAQEKSFRVGVEVGGNEYVMMYGRKNGRGDLRVLEMSGWFTGFTRNYPGPVTIREGMPPDEITQRLPGVQRDFGSKLSKDYRPAVRRERCFLQIHMHHEIEPNHSFGIPIAQARYDLEQEISRIIHLPALRGNPRRTYRTAAVEDRYPGPFDTYTAGVVAAWQNRGRTEPLTQLRTDLEELGLTWKVEARQLDDTQVELLVGRLPHARGGGARDLVNIADVGFGVSQTLPVIVALLAAENDQLVYLEQPEIHLHPRAQRGFASLLLRAVQRGVRVVVETHSSLLIRGVQTLTAQGLLDPKQVALHWFTRDEKTGNTTVTSGELDESGAYGQWPEDFDDVYLEAESNYLDAAARAATR